VDEKRPCELSSYTASGNCYSGQNGNIHGLTEAAVFLGFVDFRHVSITRNLSKINTNLLGALECNKIKSFLGSNGDIIARERIVVHLVCNPPQQKLHESESSFMVKTLALRHATT